MSIGAEMRKIIRDALRAGGQPVRVQSGGGAGLITIRAPGPGGKAVDYNMPTIYEQRCVLIVDLVGFSRRSMEEQFLLVETMNAVFEDSDRSLRARHRDITQRHKGKPVWDLYKGTGDGAIFAFGEGLNPISVRDALAFATWTMSRIIRHRNGLSPNALNALHARMALSFGPVFQTQDLAGNRDILGDAINVCARLASSKRAQEGSILVDEDIYRSMMINAVSYFRNDDDSLPAAGTVSDFVLGVPPSPKDFLYVEDDGLHETKDRFLRAYNVAGRLEDVEIRRTPPPVSKV